MKRLKWKLGSVYLEIGARFAWIIQYAWKSMWMHLMELLDDVCHMESRFGLFRNSVSFGARYVSRVSVRGILTDVHKEIACTQVEAPNSTLYPVTRTVIDDRSLEDGKGVERIDQGSRASYC